MQLMKANHVLIGIIWTGLRPLSGGNQPVGRCAADLCSSPNVSDLQQELKVFLKSAGVKEQAEGPLGSPGFIDLHRSQLWSAV